MHSKNNDRNGDPLIFYVNGIKICEPQPDPKWTLLQYLRRILYLPGTKEGCGQGGCGSCTVMISKYDVVSKCVHYAVNACIFPICAAHGLAITTVEGVGNPATGLHAIQQRLIESHGLQCGFCTPGFVMSAFALQRNYPNPTREQIERAIEGNLCRCTGYRSIVDALFACSEEKCPLGDACCKQTHKEDNTVTEDKKTDVLQIPIFPPELQIHCDKFFSSQVEFSDGYFTWIRPVSLKELLVLKQTYPRAPIIMGNTDTARFLAKGNYDSDKVLIYGGSIRELKGVTRGDDGVTVGGACTLSELSKYLEEIVNNSVDKQGIHTEAFRDMLSTYGSEQIRNVSTIAGSIMCESSTSDVKTLFKALNIVVTVESGDGNRKTLISDVKLQNNEVITSVLIPQKAKGEISAFYKLSERRTFSAAKVNSGMFAKINDEHNVVSLRLCFGGIARDTLVLTEVSQMAAERHWDDSLFQDVLAVIANILDDGNDNKEVKYKSTVAGAMWFKFFHKVGVKLELCELDSNLTNPVSLPPYHSRQVFDDYTDSGQSDDNALGRSIPNVHSETVVSGEAIYVDDIPKQQDELFLALVLSRKARAKILNVDPSKALIIPGVKHYIDHKDIPGQNAWGNIVQDQELFCSEEVFCCGQIIGGIVAENREIAQKAVSMVSIEYEEMKPILTIEDAIASDSYYGETNRLIDGDADRGLAESDHVIEGEYKTGLQEHLYMEPQAALAIPKENQELEINVTCHGLTRLQAGLSKLLQIPMHKITCKVKRLGGSFGGKDIQPMNVAGPAAIAALRTKRTVRCVLPRRTDMLVKGKRHPFLAKYRVGFDRNGKITALDMNLYTNAGHSLDCSDLVMEMALTSFDSGYKVKNIRVVGYLCKTNIPSNTAFRGFGYPQGALIMEDIIFQIAQHLKLSSEKIRDINLYREGDVATFGKILKNCMLPLLWQKCKTESKFDDRLKGAIVVHMFQTNKVMCITQDHSCKFISKLGGHRDYIRLHDNENSWKKRGISMTASKYPIGWRVTFMHQGAALVNIYTDGSVLVSHGGVEMGQGLNTKLIQVASSVLGISREKIHTVESSTREIPNTIETSGSMGTDLYAPAVKNACEILNERLSHLKDEMRGCSWEDLIHAAFFKRIQLSATGFNRPVKTEHIDPNKKGGELVDYLTYGVACTEVEIDVLTGETQVLQADLYMDIGKSLNPAIDIGQIEGAFVQGLGMVTSESMEIDEKGRTTNCSAVGYAIPNITSIPRKMTVNLIKNHNIVTSFNSSKGVGEPPYLLSLSVMTAIKEAVLAARTQIGENGYFRLDSPATVQRIQEACGPQIYQ